MRDPRDIRFLTNRQSYAPQHPSSPERNAPFHRLYAVQISKQSKEKLNELPEIFKIQTNFFIVHLRASKIVTQSFRTYIPVFNRFADCFLDDFVLTRLISLW